MPPHIWTLAEKRKERTLQLLQGGGGYPLMRSPLGRREPGPCPCSGRGSNKEFFVEKGGEKPPVLRRMSHF